MISIQNLIGFLRSPAAGRVRGQAINGILVPIVEQRIDDRPGHLDFVTAGEQRRIANHAVEQQRLVGRMRVVPECFGVREVHVDGGYFQARRELVHCAGRLHLKSQ